MTYYRIFVTVNNHLEIVDIRSNPDLTKFVGRTFSRVVDIIDDSHMTAIYLRSQADLGKGTVLLGYLSESHRLVNVIKGDYVNPGYVFVSANLDELFSGEDGSYFTKKCVITPLEGNYLVNPKMLIANKGSILDDGIVGWALRYIMFKDEDGIFHPIMEQIIPKEAIQGFRKIRINIIGSAFKVTFRGEVLQPSIDGGYIWCGSKIDSSSILNIAVHKYETPPEIEFIPYA